MVPEGWTKSAVGDCSDTVMGFAFSSADFVEHGVPLVRMGNLYQNQLDLGRKAVSLPANFLDEYQRFVVTGGDLVMSMTGTLGKRDYGFTVVLPKDTEACLLNQRVMKFVPKDNTDGTFLLYLLRSDAFLNKLYSFPGGTKQANLSASQVKEIRFPCPPLPEQRKIADILSTWDQAIETTEALLANARTQKRALMQQLLTGKRRFPAFEGQSWKEVRLGDVASISMGSSPKSAAYNDDGIGLPLIQGNADVKNGRSVPRTFTSEITTRCQPGDILLSVRAPVGSVAISDHEACVGRGAAVIRPKDQNDWLWLKHLMLWLEPRWSRVSQGSTFEAVNSKDLKTFVVPVPATTEEAKHIGSAIEAAHLDCDALSGQITKLRTEKKALMQQLLTGKRRVVV